MLVTSLLTMLVAVLLLKAFVAWFEPRMAFYPLAGVQDTPGTLSLPYVDLRIPTQDGETLHGWWLEHPHARGQVIFWHGNGGNLSLWLDVVADLYRHELSVLAVDYRGYGGSTGRPTEQGVYRDADATVREFSGRLKRPDLPVIFWGRSLGSPVAAYAASRWPPDAVVLETPMPDVRTMVRDSPVLWLLSFVASYRFPTSMFLEGYMGPLLIVHGERDTIVPFTAGRRVFERSPSPRKTFVPIPGAGHNDLHFGNPTVYWRTVDAFIAGIEPPAR